MMILPATLIAINRHALAEFPKEACGMIVDGAYVPCFNYATQPERDFVLAAQEQARVVAAGGRIEAIVHSHPNGQRFPSENDMRSQINSGYPFVIVATDGERCFAPTIWGDSLPIAPILGREFMHGVHDCYSLVRDTFRLGSDALAAQGVPGWPLGPVNLPDFPRDDAWWGTPGKPGKDLYADGIKRLGIKRLGFKIVAREECRPGDSFLARIKSDVLNHAGVLLGNNLIMHHLPGRLSRREPAGLWGRAAEMWVRWEPNR